MTDFAQNYGLLLDALDMALAAAIIYLLSLLIKGAMAVRVLAAVAALLLSSMLSRFAGLDALRLIFNSVLGSSFVILAIIFQTDIRRVFATLNRSRHGKEREKRMLRQSSRSLLSPRKLWRTNESAPLSSLKGGCRSIASSRLEPISTPRLPVNSFLRYSSPIHPFTTGRSLFKRES